MKIRVHPIQLQFAKGKCGLCGADEPKRFDTTPDRVSHMVHLVKEHLPEVQATFSAKGRSEEVFQDVEA